MAAGPVMGWNRVAAAVRVWYWPSVRSMSAAVLADNTDWQIRFSCSYHSRDKAI
jgi:hypothetical protein